jgi:putative glutamate/gamma-aminobutyrate antiporter
MINVAVLGSVKNWPVTAEYGFSSIFYLLFASLVFFIPVSLVAAELATGWPKAGGIFVWVKEAFGHRMGFLSVWLLWTQNVIFLPTMLAVIAASFAYVFNPALSDNALYNALFILVLIWGTTGANLRGMRTSSWISTGGVVLGTFVPGALIIGLGLLWYFEGRPSQIEMTWGSFLPNMASLDHWVLFAGVILSLAGMEMSAVHAKDVKHPRRDYPRAILLSAILVVGLSILGVLSIAIVIPQGDISLVAGSLQAFAYFVDAYGLTGVTPVIAALIAIGIYGSMSTWLAGPSKGLLAAARSGDLPPRFRAVNKHGMPSALLILQGVIVSVFSLVFVLMPTVNSAYWIIVALDVLLYLVMYLLMFAAAIKLRYKHPDVERPYKVPGGNAGMWVVSGLGIVTSLFSIVVGLLPPAQFSTGNAVLYVLFLIVGTVLICIGPSVILWFKKPAWNHPLPHETAD